MRMIQRTVARYKVSVKILDGDNVVTDTIVIRGKKTEKQIKNWVGMIMIGRGIAEYVISGIVEDAETLQLPEQDFIDAAVFYMNSDNC